MNISVHLGWWVVPALFALVGIVLFVGTNIATRNKPAFIAAGPVFFPTWPGLGRYILACILLVIGAALVAGHFLR